jgi:hypothetical protein
MRGWILAAALLLGGCSFAAERPLFGPEMGAHPFADRSVVEMRHRGRAEESERLVFRIADGGYDLGAPPFGKPMMQGLLFIPVEATPYEDYVLQMQERADAPRVVFGFVWRSRDRYRMILDPDEFNERPAARDWLAARCRPSLRSDCVFTGAADVLAFHRDFVAPIYVRWDKAPNFYYELVTMAVLRGDKTPPAPPG